MMRKMLALAVLVLVCSVISPLRADDQLGLLKLKPKDKIILIGNTLAERMQHFNHWETLLHSRFPQHNLTVRNLGWSADEIMLRPRSQDFDDHGHTLLDHQPDVILAFFGFNESFAGEQGLPKFKADLATFLEQLRKLEYPTSSTERGSEQPKTQDAQGQATKVPRIVLVSPIANEDRHDRSILAGTRNNANLELYAKAMQEVASAQDVRFVDLFTPTRDLFGKTNEPVTINGVHLNELGDREVGRILDQSLFGTVHPSIFFSPDNDWLSVLKGAVAEKNLQHWYDYRAVNGFYIYGGRKEPFGVVNFPAEFAKLRKMVAVRDQRIWDIAEGKEVSEVIDDSQTGYFAPIETNFKNEVYVTTPDEALKSFTLSDGFEISLWASEVDFPDLKNPVSFTFDNKGRLYVTTMPSYPMYLPGTPVDDKILILEDANHDGQADKQTVFAKGLHLPLGIELADGGAYVSTQPNLTFLKDTDGDDQADVSEIRLHGFDSADSHHSISAFETGPGGELYFQEGTFHHTQVETPYGPERVKNAAVFRYEPRTEKFDIFVSYSFANPWGHCFDKWGQDWVADASGGANYFAAAFSGDVDYERKHPSMKEFLVKQWRPTCGCEIVSSRHFPEDMQGDYLLNNCIGFQGVLQYRFKEEGSGKAADPVEPLMRSSDPNFRPVDLMFAPDGSLFILDWFNPLVGHMQHNLRDPNRDHMHGRIWRITNKNKPLVEPSKIAGEPLPALLELLKVYEDRTRFRVRRELGERPTAEVVAAVDKWVAGLDAKDEQLEHHVLEALWVKQHHDAVDVSLLDRVLTSPNAEARAAGVRVLCYWRDRVPDVLAKLQQAVNDEHPRVRIEGVRALSFFDNQEALDIAVESLVYEQDVYLEYCLKETLETLDQRIKMKGK